MKALENKGKVLICNQKDDPKLLPRTNLDMNYISLLQSCYKSRELKFMRKFHPFNLKSNKLHEITMEAKQLMREIKNHKKVRTGKTIH